MELWDVYTVDREKTGRTWQRGNRLENGDYHLVIHVCIFNKDGQMLIQQRQPFKDGWSNMWDITVGGSATVGDTSQQAAMRELEEEIGLKLDLSNTRPHLTVNFDEGFDDIYLVEADVDLNELTGHAVQYAESRVYNRDCPGNSKRNAVQTSIAATIPGGRSCSPAVDSWGRGVDGRVRPDEMSSRQAGLPCYGRWIASSAQVPSRTYRQADGRTDAGDACTIFRLGSVRDVLSMEVVVWKCINWTT